MIAALALAACGAPTHRKTPKPTPVKGEGNGRVQQGMATWYGEPQRTASGERFDKSQLTAAHRTLRFGTRVRVTNKRNGRTVVVRINDRGPFGNAKRIIDVSEAAARILGMIEAGVVPVTLEVLP